MRAPSGVSRSTLEIGAARLLKDKTKVHVRLLTSSPPTRQFTVPDAKNYGATKADFERAFADFKGATANDVFVVYLAGHGVSVGDGGAAGNTYLYLTQEATTTDRSVLAIENSRRVSSITPIAWKPGTTRAMIWRISRARLRSAGATCLDRAARIRFTSWRNSAVQLHRPVFPSSATWARCPRFVRLWLGRFRVALLR